VALALVAALALHAGAQAARDAGSGRLEAAAAGPSASSASAVTGRLSRRVYVPRGLRLVYRPRLLVHGAHSELRDLRWRRWGRKTTTARGVLDYSDASARFRAPIRVRLSNIGTCGRKRTYLRQTITFLRDSDRRRWGALDGTTRLLCP